MGGKIAMLQGVLLKAARLGDWLLLDEVNLASADTLNCISALLDAMETKQRKFNTIEG